MNDENLAYKRDTFQFYAPPPAVGKWIIGGAMGLHCSVSKRPNWLHKHMARLLLGWEWKDL